MARLERLTLQPFVERLAFHSTLDAEEQEAILSLPFQTRHLRARVNLVDINEKVRSGWIVAEGLVGRVGETANGRRQITAFHIAGDSADLNSAMRPMGCGGLTTLSPSIVQYIPAEALLALVSSYPKIAEALWRDCLVDSAISMQWLVNIGRRDALSRLAHLICEMAIRFGGNGKPAHSFAFPVIQEQLGDATGLTPVYVNRCLKKLEALITVKAGSVRVHDWAGLMKAGDFDAAYLIADTAPYRRYRPIAA